jgi:hypothetical protein
LIDEMRRARACLSDREASECDGSLKRGSPASQVLARSGVGQPSCIATLRTQKLGMIAVIELAKYTIFPKSAAIHER